MAICKRSMQENKLRLKRFGFLLLLNFSLIAFSSAIEPLRMAIGFSGDERYETVLVSHDGGVVASSLGVEILVDCCINDIPSLDAVFVCGGSPIARTGNEAVI